MQRNTVEFQSICQSQVTLCKSEKLSVVKWMQKNGNLVKCLDFWRIFVWEVFSNNQGWCRTKIENCNLILDANWAQNLIPMTPKAIQAIFIEIWHLGVFRSNISDPFFWNLAICFGAFYVFFKNLNQDFDPPTPCPWEFPCKVVIPFYIRSHHKEPPV